MATETEETTELRSQMWKHEDFVEWATEEGYLTSKMSQAQTIAVFAAKRNEYRRTDRYRSMVESHREDAAEAKAEAAAARKAANAEKKAAAEKAAPKEKAAPAKAAAKKTTAAKRGGKSTEENPFD